MKIAIVGTGKMGSGFAGALKDKHEVWLGSRDTEKGKQAAAETGATGGGAYADVVGDADVVILAVPWTAAQETIGELGDLSGKVLIDITNPYTAEGLVPLEGTSTAEEIQKWAKGASVVKGWNHVYSTNLSRPAVEGVAASVLIAGDDEKAKETVSQIARDMGFDPVDVGELSMTRALERFLKAMGALKLGPDQPIKVLRFS